MQQNVFGVPPELTRLLLRIALMCADTHKFTEARLILEALRSFRADLPHPNVAIAMLELYEGNLHNAVTTLEDVLRVFPNCQIARALLGASKLEAGAASGESDLAEVVDDDRDAWASAFAREALNHFSSSLNVFTVPKAA